MMIPDVRLGRYLSWVSLSILFVAAGVAAEEAFVSAYPSYVREIEDNHLVWNDGTKMLWDDGIEDKSVDDFLNRADLQDSLLMDYFLYDLGVPPAKGHNPGSYRYQPFFEKMYGKTAPQVESHLANVDWFGTTVRITKINGVAEKLRAVREEIKRHPHYAEWKLYLQQPGGGYYWRRIHGTQRLSMHAFGIAIDLNPNLGDYADWETGGDNQKEVAYKNRVPLEIVEIFERYGFAWGGRKYWFDTMHFEYRPEILIRGQ